MGQLLIEELEPSLFEQVILQENNVKTYKIVGPFIECNITNRNKRIYPSAVVKPQIDSFQKLISEGRAVGELNHPNSLEIDPKNIALKILKLNFDASSNNIVLGEAKICTTPNGMIVRALIDDGVKLGVSSRGAGTLKGNIVQGDYKFISEDIVWDPSAPSAFVDGILESKSEWILENGILVEREIDQLKQILNTTKKPSKELVLEVFSKALSILSSKYK